MKKLTALFALATGLSVLTSGTVQAGPHHHASSSSFAHTCGSCGGAVYRQRVVVGYDHCGDPVYGWRTAAHRCASRQSHNSGGHGGHGINSNGGHHHSRH